MKTKTIKVGEYGTCDNYKAIVQRDDIGEDNIVMIGVLGSGRNKSEFQFNTQYKVRNNQIEIELCDKNEIQFAISEEMDWFHAEKIIKVIYELIEKEFGMKVK